MSILTFTDVRKAYGPQEVLRGATFFVGPGRKVALVGPNGAGKTTLLRLALGEERADGGRISLVAGTRVGLLEQEPLLGDARTVLESAQRPTLAHREAWAELLALESSLEAGEEAALAAYDAAHHRYQELHGYECETRAREVLAGLGFPMETWEKPVAVLSGGERTRLALVQLLVVQPDLLLLDEPTNHVDWEACEWLQEYLGRYPGSVLLVSHDRYFIDRVADEVVSLEDGQTRTYQGNYSAFTRKRAAERAQQEELYRRQQMEIERQEAIIQRLRSHRKFDAMHSREKVLARLTQDGPEAPSRRSGPAVRMRPESARATGQVALTARGLGFAYGSRSLFGGLSFTLERGERLGVIGPNGIGKSTLLKVLAGELKPAAGEVTLGYNVDAVYFAQDRGTLDPEATVVETLDSAADLTTTLLFQTLHQFGFMGSAVEKPVSALSGGERTRLALACLIVRRPNVLLLDEPTNHLDITSRESVEGALAAFKGTIVVVSHDRYFLERVPTRLLELRPGLHRFFDGTYSRYRESLAAPPPAKPAPRKASPAGLSANGARRAAANAPAKRLRELERSIESTEARVAELTQQLADPDTYRADRAAALSSEYNHLTHHLESLYAEWSSLAG